MQFGQAVAFILRSSSPFSSEHCILTANSSNLQQYSIADFQMDITKLMEYYFCCLSIFSLPVLMSTDAKELWVVRIWQKLTVNDHRLIYLSFFK